ncbi:hypothetical protein AB0K15_44345 [Amycolatopsis sp. NPDC049253]|uniref:hypothetical protein n=1 Tax=Amycolatopsis sp. NPDC049253 TaxID=3155274 RepID=UPI003445E246
MSRNNAAAPHSAPEGGCPDGHRAAATGTCPACGEWLPTAWCRNPACGWRSSAGEGTLDEVVLHHHTTGHSVRVLID